MELEAEVRGGSLGHDSGGGCSAATAALLKRRTAPGSGRSCIKERIQGGDTKQKKVVKCLKWADEVGLQLYEARSVTWVSKADYGICPSFLREGVFKSGREDGKRVAKGVITGQVGGINEKEEGCKTSTPSRLSYKEVLVQELRQEPENTSKHLPGRGSSPLKSKGSAKTWWKGRCFRCLASDHFVAACRDPVRCRTCRKTGHRVGQCKEGRRKKKEGELRPAAYSLMERENHRRGRVRSSKAYVPYTEEFLRRADLRRNAVLVDVVQPADLGLAPQQTLANALARRFGGYSHDFFIFRYRERDFVIIYRDGLWQKR